MTLINRLVLLANRHGHALHLITTDWTARPTSTQRLQSNGYDCGIWVLSSIAATLRGFHQTGALEADMSTIRRFLLNLVLSMPT
jgi:Ulp1 family protease